MESNPKFEILPDTGPEIKVTGDTAEVVKENPRYKLVGEYNKSNGHPTYEPSGIFRDMKWLLAYDKQVAKYPKRFKPRNEYAARTQV